MPTFVLRLQPPEAPSQATIPLRGVVDEISTGTTSTFVSASELVCLLTTALRAGAADRASEVPPR